MENKTVRIYGLDVLRCVAISLVVLSHCTYLLFPDSTHFLLQSIRAVGAVGVDLFFVLSGFLIGGILLRLLETNKTKLSDLFNFWKRRWFRTLPNYFFVLLLNIGVFYILFDGLPDRLWLFFPFLQNFSSPHPDFFTEAWSLSIEEYAYLLLPLLLYLGYRLFTIKNKQKGFFLITLLIMFSLIFFKIGYYFNGTVTSYHDWSAGFRKVVIYRLDAIYMGFLLVYVYRKCTKLLLKLKAFLFFTGLGLFSVLHLVIYAFNILPETHLWFYTFLYLQLIGVSICLVFPYILKVNNEGGVKRVVQFISKRSYAIYLINYSLVLVVMQTFTKLLVLSIFQKMGVIALFLSITIAFSSLLYSYFELPILKYRDKKYKR